MVRRIVATLALVGILAPAARAQVKLEFKATEGTERHKVAIKVDQTLTLAGVDVKTGSESDVGVTSTTGAKRDDGTRPIGIVIDSIRSTITIMGREFTVDSADKDPKIDFPPLAFVGDLIKATRGASYTVVLDAKGGVKAVEGTEKVLERANDLPPPAAADFKGRFGVDHIRQEFEQEHGVFPDGLVREGEPWERTETSDIGSGQTLTMKKRYEYKGTVQKDGKTLDKVEIKALDVTFKMDPAAESPAKVTKSDLKVASSEGSLLFDREAGTVVERSEKNRITGDMTIVLKMNDAEQELPAKLDLTIATTSTSERVAK